MSHNPAIAQYLLDDVKKWTSSHIREERRINSTVCAKLTWGKIPISRVQTQEVQLYYKTRAMQLVPEAPFVHTAHSSFFIVASLL